MGLRELKKQLQKQDRDQLQKILLELYKNIPAAKDFLDVYATGDIQALIEKHKTTLEEYLYPKGSRMITNEKEARKLIRTLHKMNIPELTIGLKLHYAHCCITMMEKYGFHDEPYEVALEKQFHEAVAIMEKEGMYARYDDLITDLTQRGGPYGILEEW